MLIIEIMHLSQMWLPTDSLGITIISKGTYHWNKQQLSFPLCGLIECPWVCMGAVLCARVSLVHSSTCKIWLVHANMVSKWRWKLLSSSSSSSRYKCEKSTVHPLVVEEEHSAHRLGHWWVSLHSTFTYITKWSNPSESYLPFRSISSWTTRRIWPYDALSATPVNVRGSDVS